MLDESIIYNYHFIYQKQINWQKLIKEVFRIEKKNIYYCSKTKGIFR
jgi:hypothetical protein